IPAFPLANGLLTGKYRRGETPAADTRMGRRGVSPDGKLLDKVDALREFGAERGRTLLEVAISGLLAQPAMTSVIAGATRPEQVAANVAAGDWELNEQDLRALDGVVSA